MESLLITGANGFLGSHLAQFFQKNNTKIYGISHGNPINSNVEQIHDDILSVKTLPTEISNILHFAALTDIQFCENNPDRCFEINVNGTKNMLELARKNDSKFIFASSSHVYGKPDSLPIDENSSLKPISIHAKSKVQAESICEEYAKLYGLRISIVRTFSIYGQYSPSYSIISRIINQILSQEKIILGNINARRDFLHVSDFLSAIDILNKNNNGGCLKFNIGYGKSFSIKEICEKFLEISQENLTIESNSSLVRNNEIDELICDNSKLKKLGWIPKLSIDQGLTDVFDWFKSKSKNTKYS
jgi:nucleoside-diphosphate-sugar epimerase